MNLQLYRLPESQTGGLDELAEVIAGHLRKRLPEAFGDLENVAVELRSFAIHRAVDGSETDFYERVFNIYRATLLAGGFPCGRERN